MRIVDVDVIPIAISDPPLRNSWGVHEPVRAPFDRAPDDGRWVCGLGRDVWR